MASSSTSKYFCEILSMDLNTVRIFSPKRTAFEPIMRDIIFPIEFHMIMYIKRRKE